MFIHWPCGGSPSPLLSSKTYFVSRSLLLLIWLDRVVSSVYSVSFIVRAQLFTHHILQYSPFSGVSPLPCLYGDCMCTFRHLMHREHIYLGTMLTFLSFSLSLTHRREETIAVNIGKEEKASVMVILKEAPEKSQLCSSVVVWPRCWRPLQTVASTY